MALPGFHYSTGPNNSQGEKGWGGGWGEVGGTERAKESENERGGRRVRVRNEWTIERKG